MTQASMMGSVEASEVLGINKSTLVRWVAKGRITPVHKNPGPVGAYVFEEAEVRRVLNERAADADDAVPST